MKLLEQYYLQPGFIYATIEGTLVKTVLGSCVAVCLWDQRLGSGGVNHYIYPRRLNHQPTSNYGDVAIPYLIRLMTKLGSNHSDLVAHVVGGATSPLINSSIGQENSMVAKEILLKYGIRVATWDIGGSIGRKVIFNTGNGNLLVNNCMQIRESG